MPKAHPLGCRFLFLVLGIVAIIFPQPAFSKNHALTGLQSFDHPFCTINQQKNSISEAIPSPTVTATPTIPVTLTLNLTPTITPTVTTPETITNTPLTVASEPGDLNADTIFQLINSHRTSLGLPEYKKDDQLCSLAQSRRGEIVQEAQDGNYHAGLYARNLPYWVTENMKFSSDENGTVDWWLHSSLHRKAIEGNYQYSCGTCVGNVCIQLFTSYTPK